MINNVYLALHQFGYSLPDGGVKAGSFIQVIRLAGADPLAASQSYQMKIVNRHNPADVSYVTFTVHFAKDGNTHDLQLEQTGNGAGGLCPPCRLTASLRTVSNTALITAAA
jgi:hypothetical protein